MIYEQEMCIKISFCDHVIDSIGVPLSMLGLDFSKALVVREKDFCSESRLQKSE